MKNFFRSLAVVLAVGAMGQTFYVYAQEAGIISIEKEEQALMDLIELKRQVDVNGEPYTIFNDSFKDDGEEILNEEDFKESFTTHALRYIQAIEAEETLREVIQRPEFRNLYGRDNPGI